VSPRCVAQGRWCGRLSAAHAMTRRITGLEHIDPRVTELPHGTEVTTRVDHVLPAASSSEKERRVPMGTIGRVMRTQGDGVDVKVVGLGTLQYKRDELVPRRVGQALFAVRRALDWDALSGCVVLEATVGSRAWGLAVETSDEDKRGAFAHPLAWLGGLTE